MYNKNYQQREPARSMQYIEGEDEREREVEKKERQRKSKKAKC